MEEDLYPSLKQHEATYLGDKLENQWEKQLNRENPSLWRAIFKMFGREIAWLALLQSFTELCAR